MRLRPEVEKQQAAVLLQRALVTPPPCQATPGCRRGPCPWSRAAVGSLRGLIRPSLQAQWRDLTVRQARETEEELGRQQREHYEATIQRHLCFIDQVTLPGKRGARAGVSGPAGPMGQGEGQDRVPDQPGPLGAF